MEDKHYLLLTILYSANKKFEVPDFGMNVMCEEVQTWVLRISVTRKYLSENKNLKWIQEIEKLLFLFTHY